MRKLPIGIQSFEDLRTNGYLYVDKTAYVYKLANEGKTYFLGRPRRFGKSLLLSTIEAYFLGQKELFEGLAISELEEDWTQYPVFHIDLNVENYSDPSLLESGLDSNLWPLEEIWGRNPEDADRTPSARFRGLIRRAYEKTGKKVVVLIDEYDKPLLAQMEDPEAYENIKNHLKGFYGVLKSADQWLRFVLLTGVTKFSQVSVFSDLNQLQDISLNRNYAEICGITSKELTDNFDPELHRLAEENDLSYEETLVEMEKRYDGYHFSENSDGMFNPFSVLNTFSNGRFSYYWFKTGTPTFLIKLLQDAKFDILQFRDGIHIHAQTIDDYRIGGNDPVPLLYQSGYLTIKDYDTKFKDYVLGFPNDEVEYGFLNELLPAYVPQIPSNGSRLAASDFVRDLLGGDIDSFMARLKSFFAGIPYELNDRTERHYQVVFYLLFTLMGQFVKVEVRSAKGRADAVIELPDTVYVFEFKLLKDGHGDTAEDALKQIEDKGYMVPYEASGRKLIKIGVQFDAEERNVGDWKAVTQ